MHLCCFVFLLCCSLLLYCCFLLWCPRCATWNRSWMILFKNVLLLFTCMLLLLTLVLPTFDKKLVSPLLLFFTRQFDSCALALLLGDPVLERSVFVLSLCPSQLLLYAMTRTQFAFQAVVPLAMTCLPYLHLDNQSCSDASYLIKAIIVIKAYTCCQRLSL